MSYTLQILWKFISFEYLQIIVKPYFADFAVVWNLEKRWSNPPSRCKEVYELAKRDANRSWNVRPFCVNARMNLKRCCSDTFRAFLNCELFTIAGSPISSLFWFHYIYLHSVQSEKFSVISIGFSVNEFFNFQFDSLLNSLVQFYTFENSLHLLHLL